MTKINYYISINGHKISCDYGDDKNKAISFFQCNKDQLKATYGDLSEATLMKEITEVDTKEEMKLNEVRFILSYTPPKSNELNYYVSKSSNGRPIVVPSYDDMIKGGLTFYSESSAKLWIERHKDQLEAVYKKEVIDSIKIIPMSLTEIVIAKELIKTKESYNDI